MILSELQKRNVVCEPSGTSKARIRCPFPGHKDVHPSCVVYTEDTKDAKAGDFFCPVCKKGGHYLELLSLLTNVPANVYNQRFGKKPKVVNVKRVEAFFANLMTIGFRSAQSQFAKRQLEARGISDDTIRKYMLGFDPEEDRLTIPIQWGDDFVNIMKYSPGAPVNKFLNYAKGYGKIPVLYPQDQLRYDRIVLCGGFLKALVVAQHLNKHGYGAVSIGWGECKIPPDLIPWLAKKTIWVCYDIDNHGKTFSEHTCALLRAYTTWVGNVDLPLNANIYPKGDVNDFFGPEQGTAEDFIKILENTPQWKDISVVPEYAEECEEVSLEKLSGFMKPFNFSTSAYLSGIDDTTAHKIPKKIDIKCSGDAEFCFACNLRRAVTFDPMEGMSVDVEPRNPICMSFINIPHRQRLMVFKDYFGIPADCNKCTFKPSEELYTVRYILLSDTQADSELPIAAAIITDGGDLHCGEVCHIKGRVDQSPLSSEELRIVTEHKPKDILTQYVVRDKNLLDQFRTKDDSLKSLTEKINDINFDLERNVTFIYERAAVHTLFDLCFHSPLWIPFENAKEPGWLSVLLVSETAQGKSTIMRRLIAHYGHGTFIDAANTSVAGLVGGIKTVGKRQFVKWGILPQMDKRLVCIEEYANAPVELLRSMRAARDSGVVSMNKIDKGKANARTRTIVLSNPKKLLKPGVIIDGISLLEDLVERPEDLRRFDIGMWIPRIEADQWHPSEPPKYSAEACHELITWAWTLPPEHIVFTPEAREAIRTCTMKDNYPFLYLVGQREFDAKLARISAAIACRTYNVRDEILYVERRHVDWVEKFLRELYDDPEFGYSSRVRREADMDMSCTIDQVIGLLKPAGNPLLLCDFLMKYNRYTIDDLRAAVGDSFTFDMVKNRLLILGCIVGEEDTRYNVAYLPTKRLKKILPQVREHLAKQYAVPRYMGKGAGTI